jgi:hypothetical protein
VITGVGFGFGVAVTVTVGVGFGVAVTVTVGVGFGVAVTVTVGVGFGVLVTVTVGVGFGVPVTVTVGVGVGLAVDVAVGVGVADTGLTDDEPLLPPPQPLARTERVRAVPVTTFKTFEFIFIPFIFKTQIPQAPRLVDCARQPSGQRIRWIRIELS